MKANYITAVLEKLRSGDQPEVVLEGLQKVLQSKGHEQLYAAILRGVLRVLEAQTAENVVVKVVDAHSYEKQKDAIQAALLELGADEAPTIKTDPTLIGGYIAEANNKRLNHSYKSKLVALYRNLTT